MFICNTIRFHFFLFFFIFFVNSDKECYLKIFFKECKYAIKKKKIMNTINEELELSESDDQYDDEDERTTEY